MRARNLKPGFFTNDELAEIEPLGRILFQGLWCVADRSGRLEDRPRKIKAEVLPYDDCDVDQLLNDLNKHGFITRYESGGAQYIQVTNFNKHQNPHIKEASSTIPAPCEHSTSPVQASEQHEASPADSGFLNPDSGLLIPEPKTEPRAERAPSSVEPEIVNTEPEPDTPFGLFTVLCDVNGVEPDSIAPLGRKKQLGIAKTLLEQGYSADKTRRCLLWLRSQEWRTGGIDLGTVLSEGPKWELAGCPATAEPRKRVSHGATGAPRRTGPSFDAAIEARQAATAPG